MSDMTTAEVLAQLAAAGRPISSKLLSDYAKRGLIAGPRRRRRRAGGPGSESYWHGATAQRVAEIVALREEGIGYDAIASRLLPDGQARQRNRRMSLSVWLPSDMTEMVEEAARESGMPFVGIVQLGARLYHEAPHRDALPGADILWNTRGPRDASETELTFAKWAWMAWKYLEVSQGLQAGRLPASDLDDAYLLWRVLQDGRIAVAMLDRLGVRQEEVEREGEVVGQLTTFGSRVRLFRPVESINHDLERCRALAQELEAALVTREGHDFNHHGGAQALGLVADWIREEGRHGQ